MHAPDRHAADSKPSWPVLIILPCLVMLMLVVNSLNRPTNDPYTVMDTDDAMRMVQMLDLRYGGEWYDLTQHRLSPPQVVKMHWSRLPDLPLLAVFTTLEPFFGRERAVQLTAILTPPLLGMGLYAVFIWVVAPMIAGMYLPTAGMVCLCLLVTLAQFKPYRVDHHGWQILLALIPVGAALRAAAGRGTNKLFAFAGMAGALGLWIGAEAIPAIGLACIVFTLLWMLNTSNAARNSFTYGLSLCLSVVVLYPLALPVQDWGVRVLDAFSLISLLLALAVFAYTTGLLVLEWRMKTTSTGARFATALALAALLLLCLALIVPQALQGPYAGISPEVQDFIHQVREAQPLLKVLIYDPSTAALMVALPLLGLLLGVWQLFYGNQEERGQWICIVTFICGGIALQCWQLRTSPLANAFAGIALSWWAVAWMKRGDRLTNIVARMLVFSLPVLSILGIPFLAAGVVNSLPGTREAAQVDMPALHHLLPVLTNPSIVGTKPLLIASHINIGPRLLLQTPHQVLAAPYHRNDDGLKAIKNIFGADLSLAYATIRERNVDLLYVYGDTDNFSYATKDAPNALWTQLQQGKAPPWLVEIPIPQADAGEHLYQVVDR